ncbi:MAG: extracellular solute-binding protein [Phycisphaerales bacterium]
MILLRLLLVLFTTIAAALLPCCRKGDETKTVVLYSSVDGDFLRPITDRFTAQTGIKVLIVGDTEATKTTGLVQRLIAEKERPRADVWWSSEVLGTVQLSRAGLLEPYTSAASEKDFQGGWPKDQRGRSGDWYGFALRARVKVTPADAPPPVDGDVGKVAVANPRFGTTRSHLAHVLWSAGAEDYTNLLKAVKPVIRICDGNAAVVRAVAQGEARTGFTDYDDVVAGRRNGWKLDFEPSGPAIPNTVAIVKGGPHAAAARQLADFILSAETERALAASDSRNIPLRPAVRTEFPELKVFAVEVVNWDEVADRVDEALAIWDDAIGK